MKQKSDQRPIVCGTDFPTTATEAVNIAAALARQFETRLLLVHVDQLHRSLVSDPIIIESAALQTRCELDREAQRLRDSGADVEGKVLAGSAFDQLVTTATNAKARSPGRKQKLPAVLRFKREGKSSR